MDVPLECKNNRDAQIKQTQVLRVNCFNSFFAIVHVVVVRPCFYLPVTGKKKERKIMSNL